MTTSADIDALLANLTWDNWFEMLPILADAYREQKDSMGDAIDYLIANRKRPNVKGEGSDRTFWWYQYQDEETSLGEMTYHIDKINIDWWHDSVVPLLTGYLAAWEEGHRPADPEARS